MSSASISFSTDSTPSGIALQRLERRDAHDRQVVAREAVALEQVAHLELDQVEQLGIVDRVDLVQGDDDVRHVDLLGEQHVLARLRHRAVDRAHDQDRAVHLRGAGDHVLDVVGVARAVDVRVVPVRRAVLDVARRDRQNLGLVAAALRLGGLGHFVVRHELGPALVGGHLGQRRGQRRLAVVDVADRAHVHVRLRTIKLLLRHCSPSPLVDCSCPSPFELSYFDSLVTSGADDRDRTGDLVLTKDALCQLSYIGPLRSLRCASADKSASRHSPQRTRSARQPRRQRVAWPARRSRERSERSAKAGAGDGDRTRDQQLGRL